MSDATLSLLVLAAAVVLFVWNRLPVGVVAVLTALALAATGVLTSEQALAGFGDPVVVFIAALFVLSEGLESSGVTAWAGQQLLARTGQGRTRVVVALMLLSAVLAAVVTPNGATAALIPVMVLAARRSGMATSRAALPLAYAASAGALLTLSGSTVNVIASDALAGATGERFGYLEFAVVGAPLVLVTIAVTVLLGDRLLPERTPATLPRDFSAHVDTLVEHYRLDHGFFRLAVPAASPLAGTALRDVAVPPEVVLVGAQDAAGGPCPDGRPVTPGDVLVVSGPAEGVTAFAADQALTVARTPLTRRTREALLDAQRGLAEVLVAPRSELVGTAVFPGMVRAGTTVLAVSRRGRDVGPRPVALAEGDALLVHGSWDRIEALAASEQVLVVDSPDSVRRQTVALGPRAGAALAVLAVTVVLLATGVVAPAVAGLLGAVAMVVTGVVTPQQAYRAISWQTVVLVGGLIPLSVAIRTSGAADLLAGGIVGLVPDGDDGRLLLVALFVLTAVLGQIVSNTATVLIVVPVALAAAEASGVHPAPVLMLVAVAGAASFLTPIATPANMMVMAPGGYRFGDYWRLGLVTMLAWLAVAVLLVPLVWPFSP
ncbi:SLC13 family permease [Cellulomonas sp. ES6]|uniref:SLC13 family permease n=1 Tax=Cellulomonas sp. ES6 TaxID=3039384 RepID=UPI0019ABA06F|nr:SLC13 family permease [Cellulomonas sp. ES6]MBD3779391.1 SLC13 family permease [Micrococcales bacterium]WHP16677.1 SLC13 family permease [Cellulomonas sp. ES6]